MQVLARSYRSSVPYPEARAIARVDITVNRTIALVRCKLPVVRAFWLSLKLLFSNLSRSLNHNTSSKEPPEHPLCATVNPLKQERKKLGTYRLTVWKNTPEVKD